MEGGGEGRAVVERQGQWKNKHLCLFDCSFELCGVSSPSRCISEGEKEALRRLTPVKSCFSDYENVDIIPLDDLTRKFASKKIKLD